MVTGKERERRIGCPSEIQRWVGIRGRIRRVARRLAVRWWEREWGWGKVSGRNLAGARGIFGEVGIEFCSGVGTDVVGRREDVCGRLREV